MFVGNFSIEKELKYNEKDLVTIYSYVSPAFLRKDKNVLNENGKSSAIQMKILLLFFCNKLFSHQNNKFGNS